MESYIGQVRDVTAYNVGADVAADVAAGATVVPVFDTLDLPVGVGELRLPDGSVVTASGITDDSITLAAPLPVALAEMDRVEVPAALEHVATVDVDGRSMTARVQHTLVASLRSGVRVDEDAETVRIERSGTTFLVVEVLNRDRVDTWGDPDGVATQLSSRGAEFFTLGPSGRYRATSLGSGEDRLGVFNAEGQIIGGVTAEGEIVGQYGTIAGDLAVGGVPLMGRLWDNSPGAPQGWMERFAAGDVASVTFYDNSGPHPTATEMGYVKIGFTARAGRSYWVEFTAQIFSGKAGSAIRSRLRYVTGSAEPTVTSTLLSEDTSPAAYGSLTRMTCTTKGHMVFTEDTLVKVMYSFEGLGDAVPEITEGVFEVFDRGPQGNYSGGTYTTGREATPPPTVREYVSTWATSGFRVYDETGQPTGGDQIHQWSWTDGDRVYSAVAFDGAAMSGAHAGETVTTATAGATISRAEVFLANVSWLGGDSGTAALGKGGAPSLPATLAPQASVFPKMPVGAGLWVDVPPSWFSDTNRVVTLGDVDGGVTGGYFMGDADEFPPLVRLTYLK